MIGIKGQYLFSFDISGKRNFITENDLQLFKIVEEAGNVLPTFELIFTLEDQSVLRYLNEGNPLNTAMGEDNLAMTNIDLRILNKLITRIAQRKYLVRLTGVYDAMRYYTDCKMSITEQISGVEAIINVVGNYFKVDSNITKSQDKQHWIQNNIPDKSFVNKAWMHSWLGGSSFPAVGITSDGIFVLRDVKKLAKEDYAWKFISGDSMKKDELIFDQYKVESNTGLINVWTGYEREREVLNLDAGSEKSVKPTLDTVLALSKDLDRMSDIGTRTSEFGVVNANVHPNYWLAYQQNLSYLSVFGSTKIVLQFSSKYADVRVLDLVLLRDIDLEMKQAEGYYSGSYLVSRVTRVLENKNFVTMVHLNREALGELQGSFS
jgi:hypothetical protein